MGPETSLFGPLHRADGSATYASATHAVLAAVHGPIEVQRRDELPDQAAIEIIIRPSSGVGNVKERWLESVVHETLRHVILTHLHPRTLVQVSLQVTKEPAVSKGADVAELPALLNAAVLALLDAGIAVAKTFTAVLATVSNAGDIILGPSGKEIESAQSLHAFAFSQHGGMLLSQSSGAFAMETWESLAEQAERACLNAIGRSAHDGKDNGMADEADLKNVWLRTAVEENIGQEASWKTGG